MTTWRTSLRSSPAMPSILFLVCLCWLLLPGAPRAADVAGEDAPRFQAALEDLGSDRLRRLLYQFLTSQPARQAAVCTTFGKSDSKR